MPAQFLIRDLLGRTAESFAFGVYFHSGILEHILAPVLPRHFT